MMRKQLMTITTIVLLLCEVNAQAKSTLSFYCTPVNQISITSQQGAWEYLYTTPAAFVNQGIQPSLTGWGDAAQATQLTGIDWTDGALACNYAGFNDYAQPETLVMLSKPLGKSPTCNFPTNNGKTFCDSADPYSCPMVCEFGKLTD